MSQQSEFSRNIPSDVQSVQSVQTTRTAQSEGVQQQSETASQHQDLQLNTQVERQRIQRSSSSASSKTSASGGGAASGRAEGPIGTGSYQQYSSEVGAGFGASNGSLGSNPCGERRQARFRRQVIRLPDQPSGQVRQVRRRLPTPEPDTLERVYIQRTGAEVVEEITEIPTTPPPRVQERTVVEPAGAPQVIKRTIRVPPRSGAYGGYQQPQQQQQTQNFGYQTNDAFSGATNYGSGVQGTFSTGGGNFNGAQQFGAGPAMYQQQASSSFVGGYGPTNPVAQTATTFATNYGSIGGAGGLPQSQGPVTGPISFVVDAGTSQVLPPPGCQPAFCFYV